MHTSSYCSLFLPSPFHLIHFFYPSPLPSFLYLSFSSCLPPSLFPFYLLSRYPSLLLFIWIPHYSELSLSSWLYGAIARLALQCKTSMLRVCTYVHIHTDKLNDLHAYICNITCLFDWVESKACTHARTCYTYVPLGVASTTWSDLGQDFLVHWTRLIVISYGIHSTGWSSLHITG